MSRFVVVIVQGELCVHLGLEALILLQGVQLRLELLIGEVIVVGASGTARGRADSRR